jgi:hypothetical protein
MSPRCRCTRARNTFSDAAAGGGADTGPDRDTGGVGGGRTTRRSNRIGDALPSGCGLVAPASPAHNIVSSRSSSSRLARLTNANRPPRSRVARNSTSSVRMSCGKSLFRSPPSDRSKRSRCSCRPPPVATPRRRQISRSRSGNTKSRMVPRSIVIRRARHRARGEDAPNTAERTARRNDPAGHRRERLPAQPPLLRRYRS